MKTKWIQYEKTSENPAMRIFCFPYAGGSALFYSKWHKYLDNSADVFPIQLPGRESRITEPPLRVMSVALNCILEEIEPYLTDNMAFVGHSMGSIMAYETARLLSMKNMKTPKHIFLCGAMPPDLIGESEKIHELSDREFCEKLKGYESISSEMMKYEEFYKFFVPIIKADFEMIETYKPGEIWKMPFGVTVFSGEDDPYVPLDCLAQWKRYCENTPEIITYSGNHFFLKEHTEEICNVINSKMRGCVTENE